MTGRIYSVTDDSGFLALVDPRAYEGFVGPEWSFEDLLARFRAEMAARRLLIWGTGAEREWRVRVCLEPVATTGFRETIGPITCGEGLLLLTGYEGLSVAAQFDHVSLPEPHERDQLLRVEPGTYRCRVVQLHDPDDATPDAEEHFVVELLRSEPAPKPWTRVPWAEV